jgi:hypothetical protein
VNIDDPRFADKIKCRLVKTSIEHRYALFGNANEPATNPPSGRLRLP